MIQGILTIYARSLEMESRDFQLLNLKCWTSFSSLRYELTRSIKNGPDR